MEVARQKRIVYPLFPWTKKDTTFLYEKFQESIWTTKRVNSFLLSEPNYDTERILR